MKQNKQEALIQWSLSAIWDKVASLGTLLQFANVIGFALKPLKWWFVLSLSPKH